MKTEQELKKEILDLAERMFPSRSSDLMWRDGVEVAIFLITQNYNVSIDGDLP